MCLFAGGMPVQEALVIQDLAALCTTVLVELCITGQEALCMTDQEDLVIQVPEALVIQDLVEMEADVQWLAVDDLSGSLMPIESG